MVTPADPADGLFLGVDFGTGSAKGVLTTADGEIFGTAVRAATVSRPAPGQVEMDAETQWWDSFAGIARELTQKADGRRVAAVCVSGLGPCLLPTDRQLRPLRPGILYGTDNRAGEQIIEMTEALGASTVLERSGKDLSSQAVGPKLGWLRKHEPDVWSRMKYWFSAHNFVVARLTGEWVLDHHTASQCDPFYDIHTQSWAEDVAATLLPELQLPRLCWPHEIVGTVTKAAAALTGLPAGIPVAAGTIDAWAEGFSAGVSHPGDLMIMYGSTMFLVQVLPAPAIRSGLWTTSGVLAGSHTIAAGMSTTGSLLSWLHRTVTPEPYETLLSEAAEVAAGSAGLVMLPYLAGERTPIFDADARGMFLGLTLEHTRGHLFRAAHEGIAFGLRQIMTELEEMVGPPAYAIAVGGGTRDDLWPQIVCDVIGIPQQIPAVTIGASYGDALLAAIGSGAVAADTTWARVDHVLSPNPENAAIYDEIYEIYCSLYPSTSRQMHQLADVQRRLSGHRPKAPTGVGSSER